MIWPVDPDRPVKAAFRRVRTQSPSPAAVGGPGVSLGGLAALRGLASATQPGKHQAHQHRRPRMYRYQRRGCAATPTSVLRITRLYSNSHTAHACSYITTTLTRA